MPTCTINTPEFQSFMEKTKDIYNQYMNKRYPKNEKEEFSFSEGKKYIKVIRGTSVHCFVNKSNGDVLKAASWNSPAKHARGNIFDAENGVRHMGEYGPASLK